MTTFDWLIKHKETGMFLGEHGLTNYAEYAVFHRAPARPYTPAQTVKSECFEKCKLKGLRHSDFAVACGVNEQKDGHKR